MTVEGNLILDRGQPGCGGIASQGYQPAPARAITQGTSSAHQDMQLQQLQQQQGSLSYEEYQRRYREIVGR
ncbi:hypothetical protein D3C81_2239500 [compost metagenome]